MQENKQIDIHQEVQVPAFLRISKVIAYILYVWVIIGVISLVLRVFLLLFSANPTTPFVEFIYRVSADYLAPFRGIFPPRPVSETGYLDVAALFAVIVYLFVMWGFSALVQYIQFKIDESKIEQQQKIEALKREQEKLQKLATKETPAQKSKA
jgi:uncharacterized protein YggT (Ycf19 family)